MKLIIRESFFKDLKKIKNKSFLKKLHEFIDVFEGKDFKVEELLSYKIKKLTGSKNYYRIKISDYRIGIKIINDKVELLRVLHRKDIYKSFPPK